MGNLTTTQKLLILLAAWWLLGGKLPSVIAPSKVSAVTYTYEKSTTGSVPPPVLAALDKLNRAGIMATNDEVNDGAPPDQYKVSRPAAVAAGLPALVVMGGDKVLRVVKDPRTEAAVMEAAK